MAGKNTAVFGIYCCRSAVEDAIEHLRSLGFRGTDISVLLPENQGTKDFAHEKTSKAPEGAAAGAAVGGIAGGVLGWLLGIGILVIPQLRPMIAGGPIVAALAGVGALGILGGVLGALAGRSVPEYEAVRFEGRIREGGILLSVHCDDSLWVKRAKDALIHTGARDVAAAPEHRGDFANADKPMPRVGTAPVLTETTAATTAPEEEPRPQEHEDELVSPRR